MNPVIVVLIALRSAALASAIAGQVRVADGLYALADAVEAGRATDAHMAEIAAKLKERNIDAQDWDDVARRIAEDRSRLHDER
jgi:hypothetical protein